MPRIHLRLHCLQKKYPFMDFQYAKGSKDLKEKKKHARAVIISLNSVPGVSEYFQIIFKCGSNGIMFRMEIVIGHKTQISVKMPFRTLDLSNAFFWETGVYSGRNSYIFIPIILNLFKCFSHGLKDGHVCVFVFVWFDALRPR